MVKHSANSDIYAHYPADHDTQQARPLTSDRKVHSMSTDQLELFERFITSITSPSSSLPRDTILGAITHFLSTLPIEPCRRLLRVISTADFLWDTAGHAAQVREAIKLGVRAGCDRATREDAEGTRWYTMKWFKSAAVDKWVQGLLDEATHAEGRRLDLLVALLLGVAAQSDSAAAGPGCSAGMQRDVQEEVVLALEPRLGSEVPEEVETAHELLADVIEVVDTALLSLLELPVSSPMDRLMDRAELMVMGVLMRAEDRSMVPVEHISSSHY